MRRLTSPALTLLLVLSVAGMGGIAARAAEPAEKSSSVVEAALRTAEAEASAALATGDDAKIAHALVALGRQLLRNDRMAESRAQLEKALQLAVKLGDKKLRAQVLVALGSTAQEQAEYAFAIEQHDQAITLARQTGEKVVEMEAYNRLAWVYARVGQAELGLQMAQRSLEVAREVGDRGGIALALLHIGQRELELGRYESAEARAREGLQVSSPKNIRQQGTLRNLLAFSLAEQGKIAEALPEHIASEQAFHDYGDQAGRQLAASGVVHCLRKLGRFDEARSWSRLMDDPTLGSDRSRRLLSRELANLEETAGRPADALKWRNLELASRDSMDEALSRQRVTEAEVRARDSEAQRALLRMEQENARKEIAAALARAEQRRWLEAAVMGVVGLSLISGFLVYRRRVLRRSLHDSELAKKRAEEADALKTRLLGIAAHDLRGPLTNMVSTADMIHAETKEAESREYAGWIEQEGTRLLTLIQDMLDKSARESGQLSVRRESMDLLPVVEAAIAGVQEQATRKGQVIRFSGSSAKVSGDSARLRQVIDNLLSNALKFSGQGASVTVELMAERDNVNLRIKDQGPGLNAKDREQLFKPYAQLSARPTAGEASTGLGLSIVRELVEKHEGTIVVETTSSAGTTFLVRLPRLAV